MTERICARASPSCSVDGDPTLRRKQGGVAGQRGAIHAERLGERADRRRAPQHEHRQNRELRGAEAVRAQAAIIDRGDPPGGAARGQAKAAPALGELWSRAR